jgi:hypothetical protein
MQNTKKISAHYSGTLDNHDTHDITKKFLTLKYIQTYFHPWKLKSGLQMKMSSNNVQNMSITKFSTLAVFFYLYLYGKVAST